MQDFANFYLIQTEIERGLVESYQEKIDPDGLSQYYIWDEAFGGPSLLDRMRGMTRFFRSKKWRPEIVAAKSSVNECQPQV